MNEDKMRQIYDLRNAPGSCQDCWGSGKVANDDEATPWPIWDALEGMSRMSITIGLVRPVPCPQCGGSGKKQEANEHGTD